MRFGVVASSDAAREACTVVIRTGGNAVDAAVAGVLAGASLAGPGALLGSATWLVAGHGQGAWAVDGRARAPGLGDRRRRPAPSEPAARHGTVAPGLLEGALTAHNRFGSWTLSAVVRAARDAVHAFEPDADARVRLGIVERLATQGPEALERSGLADAALAVAGVVSGGYLTRDDLRMRTVHVHALDVVALGSHSVLVAPADRLSRHDPPAPPTVPVGALACADAVGALCVAQWVEPQETLGLETEFSLALPVLENAPRVGVTRRRPGGRVPMTVPGAIVASEGRATGAYAVSGHGALESVRDAVVRGRLVAAGEAMDPSYTSEREASVRWSGWIWRRGPEEVVTE